MALIKDVYNKDFYNKITKELMAIVPNISSSKILKELMPSGFTDMEWKQRLQHTTAVLHQYLDKDFNIAANQLTQYVTQKLKQQETHTFPYLFIPDYIATYGLTHYNKSIPLLELTTQLISCEFAVRPFLLTYESQMMQQMLTWAAHPHYAVRRLASEGSRPRLPWGAALPFLKKDPASCLPILKELKADPHKWVRLSVANHLNDIAKDNPEIALQLTGSWKGLSPETDAVIKHGLRTLLKKGDSTAISLFALNAAHFTYNNMVVNTPEVSAENALEFTFNITNTHHEAASLRLEYALYLLKYNGTHHKKVFKISERKMNIKETARISKKQSFRPITTRIYYPGIHFVSIIINGKEMEKHPFLLLG